MCVLVPDKDLTGMSWLEKGLYDVEVDGHAAGIAR
jgi:hypothetical protein